MEGIPPVPDKFYCELCRLSRADPYVMFPFFEFFPSWIRANFLVLNFVSSVLLKL